MNTCKDCIHWSKEDIHDIESLKRKCLRLSLTFDIYHEQLYPEFVSNNDIFTLPIFTCGYFEIKDQ
jgi:hypothetical protein